MGDKELLSRVKIDHEEMKRARRDFDDIYQELARYLKPIYEEQLNGRRTISQDSFGKYIFDGESIAAKNRMVDGLFGWLVSPAIDWLKLQSRKYKDDRNANIYLQELTLSLMDILQTSNFYDAIHETFENGVVFGTDTIDVMFEDRTRQLIFQNIPLANSYISENYTGTVDLIHRYLYMTGRQCIEEFGVEKFDEKTLKMLKDNMEKVVTILYVVYPRYYPGTFDDFVRPAKDKPFAAVYFYCGINSDTPQFVLRESGYDFKHFVTWRYKKITGYSYGISPAMDALFDIKALNLQSKSILELAQLQNRPPLLVDMGLKGKLKIAPGGITYRESSNMGIQPVFTGANYSVSIDNLERRARIIREHFRTDFFMSISQIQASSRQRTATEILELKSESAAVLGAVVGRIQSELLGPLIANVIRMAVENDMLPEPPKGLEDIDVELQFIGPLAQAQKKYLIKQGIEQGLQAAFGVAQASPDILVNFDLHYAVRELAKVNGYPEAGLVDEAEVQKRLQALAQQQQAMAAQQQQAMILQKADVNKKPEPGSILQEMTNG